jgi:hypothetical protein
MICVNGVNTKSQICMTSLKICKMSPRICMMNLKICMKIFLMSPNVNGCSNDVSCGVRHRLRRLCPLIYPPLDTAGTAYSKGDNIIN